MLKNICIYPNYRILGEFKTTTFKQGDKDQVRVSFAVSSYHPDANGVFLKLYCHAFDQVAEELIRANLKEGDLITVFCEHGLYKTRNGVMEDRYKVMNFNFVRNKKEEKPDQKESTNNSINEFMGFLNGTFAS